MASNSLKLCLLKVLQYFFICVNCSKLFKILIAKFCARSLVKIFNIKLLHQMTTLANSPCQTFLFIQDIISPNMLIFQINLLNFMLSNLLLTTPNFVVHSNSYASTIIVIQAVYIIISGQVKTNGFSQEFLSNYKIS